MSFLTPTGLQLAACGISFPMGWHRGTWGPRGKKEHPSNHLNHFTTTSPKKEPARTEWWQKGMPKEMSQRRGYLQPVLPGLCSRNTCVSWSALVSQPLRSPSWVRERLGDSGSQLYTGIHPSPTALGSWSSSSPRPTVKLGVSLENDPKRLPSGSGVASPRPTQLKNGYHTWVSLSSPFTRTNQGHLWWLHRWWKTLYPRFCNSFSNTKSQGLEHSLQPMQALKCHCRHGFRQHQVLRGPRSAQT